MKTSPKPPNNSRQISETLRPKTDAVRTTGRQQCQELLDMNSRNRGEVAHQAQKQLQKRSEQQAKHLAETFATFIPRAEQVIDQTVRRILQGRTGSCAGEDRERL